MLEPCQRCGTPSPVLIFDVFRLRKLGRACFCELVETHQIPPHSLAKVPGGGPKDVDIQKHVIEE